MRKLTTLIVVCVVGLLLCIPLATVLGEGELEEITLKLNWLPLGDHAAYYVAQEFGYYEENGLKVNIERGFGSGDTVKRVDVGTADIGLADALTIGVARAEGAEVKIITVIMDLPPFGCWSKKEMGIETPKDLEGHTVGTPAGDSQRIAFPALAKANGVDESQVTFVNISPAAKYAALGSGQVDAIFDYVTGKPFVYKAIGEENTALFRWADWGVDPYGICILTREDTIENRPEMLRAFLDASMRAWRWVIQNPQKALEIMVKYVPEINVDDYLVNLQEVITLMDTPRFQEHVIGWISGEKMERTVELINAYFEPQRPITAEEMYANEFLAYYSMP